ncbi:hypothetical protein BDN67DRAFT_183254 [Paxillus ammoniavirescens]|nr:hypothetical protein BDN67DRAFT_183254 [Paxillus ammoniavirescens]
MFSPSSTFRWKRPVIIYKKPAPPTISFIVAEPKQAATPDTAATNLPSILRRIGAALPEGSQSSSPPMSIKEHAETISLSAADNVDESPVPASDNSIKEPELANSMPVHIDHAPSTTPNDSPDQACAATTTNDQPSLSPEDASCSPASPEPTPATSQLTLSNKRSWFTMFTWSEGKETSPLEDGVGAPSPREGRHVVDNNCTNFSGEQPQPDPLASPPLKQQYFVNAVGDQSAGIRHQSLPEDVPLRPRVDMSPIPSLHSVSRLQPPPIRRASHDGIDIPSGREDDPAPQPYSGKLPNESIAARPGESTAPTVPPNTMTGRFTLSFPSMLGRSKAFEKAVGASQQEDVTELQHAFDEPSREPPDIAQGRS